MARVKEKEQQEREELRKRAESFNPDNYDYDDPVENPPNLDRFYGPLENYIRMTAEGHSGLFMLDAKGGLGKTYNVKRVLNDVKGDDWTHQKGFTTPLELYKTLWKAQEDGHVLFLDDMSGIRRKQKAIDMLKAATETDGEENWVQYRSSQDIDHPYRKGKTLPNTFCFRGQIIMSFNDTPENPDFNALKDRAQPFYKFDLDYQERLDLIREAAKLEDFSPLTVEEQQQVAAWIASVTNPAIEVSLRTLDEVCNMRHYGQMQGEDWQQMAFEVFDLDYERHLIIRLMEDSDLPPMDQIEYFKDTTGRSQGYYYKLKNEIKSERME